MKSFVSPHVKRPPPAPIIEVEESSEEEEAPKLTLEDLRKESKQKEQAELSIKRQREQEKEDKLLFGLSNKRAAKAEAKTDNKQGKLNFFKK